MAHHTKLQTKVLSDHWLPSDRKSCSTGSSPVSTCRGSNECKTVDVEPFLTKQVVHKSLLGNHRDRSRGLGLKVINDANGLGSDQKRDKKEDDQ